MNNARIYPHSRSCKHTHSLVFEFDICLAFELGEKHQTLVDTAEAIEQNSSYTHHQVRNDELLTDGPIILAPLPTINGPHIVIDGNHRLSKALVNNSPVQYIVLSVEEAARCLANDAQRQEYLKLCELL